MTKFKNLFESRDLVLALALMAGHSTQNGVSLALLVDDEPAR